MAGQNLAPRARTWPTQPALPRADWAAIVRRGRRLLRRRRGLLISSLLAGIAAAALLSALSTPQYRARALLEVRDWRKPTAPPPQIPNDQPAAIAAELLGSEQVAAPVAQRLGLRASADLWLGVGRAMKRAAVWTADVAAKVARRGARRVEAAAPADWRAAGFRMPLRPAQRSPTATHAARPGARSGLGPNAGPRDDAAAEALLGRLRVDRAAGGSLITLSYGDASAARAAAVVNALVAELQAQMNAAQSGYVLAGERFLDGRLQSAHQDWQTAEQSLLAFRAAHAADAAGPLQNAAMARLMALTEAVTRAQIDLWGQRATVAAAGGGRWLTAEELRQLSDLRLQRSQLAAQEARLAAQYGAAALPLVQARRALASVEASMAAFRRAAVAGHSAGARADQWELGRLNEAIHAQQTLLASAEQNAAQDQELATQAKARADLYADLWRQRQQMAVLAGLMENPVRVLAPARVPLRPVSPRWRVNLALGFLGGLALALTLLAAAEAGAAERVDEETLLAAPVAANAMPAAAVDSRGLPAAGVALASGGWFLGSLPRLDPEEPRPSSRPGSGVEPGRVPSPAFRAALDGLTVSLLLAAEAAARPAAAGGADWPRGLAAGRMDVAEGSAADTGSMVVLITSALPGEGKTLATTWLARALAAAGGAVLAVDCNWRSPALTLALADSPAPGLAECLGGRTTLAALLADRALSPRRADGFALLPAGSPATAAPLLLATAAMRQFLAQARRRYDWILLDAGAAMDAPETRSLAALADATVLVASRGQVRHSDLERAQALLLAAGASRIGLALNDAPRPSRRAAPAAVSARPATSAPSRRARAAGA